MRAALIFSSTSHSINVQKVGGPPKNPQQEMRAWSNSSSDLQDRPLESVRPKVHHPRDRERGRAAAPLPVLLIICRASSPAAIPTRTIGNPDEGGLHLTMTKATDTRRNKHSEYPTYRPPARTDLPQTLASSAICQHLFIFFNRTSLLCHNASVFEIRKRRSCREESRVVWYLRGCGVRCMKGLQAQKGVRWFEEVDIKQ